MTADAVLDVGGTTTYSENAPDDFSKPPGPEELSHFKMMFGDKGWRPLRSLREEFCRRLFFYSSDFTDGLSGKGTLFKLFSSIAFLYFACLLPSIAFGVLNDDNTEGLINVRKVLVAQGIVGILFSLTAGQPFVILLTTAPLAIYIKGWLAPPTIQSSFR